jgi:hypothetical protein
LAVAKKKPCYECVYLLLKYHATSIVFNNRLQSPASILKLIVASLLSSAASDSSQKATVPSSHNSPPSTNTPPLPNNNNNKTNSLVNQDTVALSDSMSTHSSWNYSTSSIHSLIIAEIFAALDSSNPAAQSATVFNQAEGKSGGPNATQSQANVISGGGGGGMSAGGRQSQSKSVVASFMASTKASKNTMSVAGGGGTIAADPVSEGPLRRTTSKEQHSAAAIVVSPSKMINKTANKKSVNQNKRIVPSNSLRNISRIKNYDSSNSLIMCEINQSIKPGNTKRLMREGSSVNESTVTTITTTLEQGGGKTSLTGGRKVNSSSSTEASPMKKFIFQKSKSSKNILPLRIMDDPVSTPGPFMSVYSTGNTPTTPTVGNNSQFLGAENTSEMAATATVSQEMSENDSLAQTPPTNITDKKESLLLKKYARHSKATPKAGSAVVMARMNSSGGKPNSVLYDQMNKQISLSNVNLINRFQHGSGSASGSGGGQAKATAKLISKMFNQEGSTSSVEGDGYLMNSRNGVSGGGGGGPMYDNSSIVSSKISLFKKAVINF